MTGRGIKRRIGPDANTWPGFVDALSTILLVIIFLLSVFVLAQFFLGQALSGRDEALDRLRGQVAELSNLLRLEQQTNEDLRANLSQISASLRSANLSNEELQSEISRLETALDDAESRLRASGAESAEEIEQLEQQYAEARETLEEERQRARSAEQEVADLTAGINALRQQIANLEAALEASEARDREQQAIIADLGRRLNVALAGKVAELARYRSEFYGRLREVLGERGDIRIEGDRFIFQAEVLFATASADIGPEGRAQLAQLASTLLEISREIPGDLDWILRVDGHTDERPISTARFASNWELSAARAISVVKFLTEQGVPPHRLAATGFGEHQPLVEGNTEEAYQRNRRIEMRFTNR